MVKHHKTMNNIQKHVTHIIKAKYSYEIEIIAFLKIFNNNKSKI